MITYFYTTNQIKTKVNQNLLIRSLCRQVYLKKYKLNFLPFFYWDVTYKYPLYHTYSSCTRCYPVPVQSSNKPCTVCTQNILFNKLIAVQFQIRPVSYDEKTLKKFVNNNKIKCRHIVKYSTVKSCTCICLYKNPRGSLGYFS